MSTKLRIAALLATVVFIAAIYPVGRQPSVEKNPPSPADTETTGRTSAATRPDAGSAVAPVPAASPDSTKPAAIAARTPDPRLPATIPAKPAPAVPGSIGTSSAAVKPPLVVAPVAPIAPIVPDAPPRMDPAATKEQRDAAAIDLDKVTLMLRDFRTGMGENPVGTNAEIMKAVMGGNPKGARLGPPENQAINAAGELIDRWGTPIFFHQLSKSDMEIRSAGPDRQMFTEDDIIAH